MNNNTVATSELVDILAKGVGITKKQAKEELNHVAGAILSLVAQGRSVRIQNFGTFVVKDVATYTTRNPATGEPIDVPAHKAIHFKASKFLKEMAKESTIVG